MLPNLKSKRGCESILQLYGMCVLCASSCFSSHVFPARLWPRPWNRTPPWRFWTCWPTTLAITGLRLGVWWRWCHQGRGAVKQCRKEGSRHGRMKPELEMRRTTGRFSHVCGIWCVLCASFVSLKSCVSCQALAQALTQNSTLTDLFLTENNIGPEGAKAWCLARMGSWGEREWCTAVWKRRQGNDVRQCNAALISRCIHLHPVEICDD